MAELALLTGLGYAGYITQKEPAVDNKKTSYSDKVLLDDYRYSQYHSDSIKSMDSKIKNIYKQRANDTMDPKKFMIPVYYGLEDKNNEMGAGTDEIANSKINSNQTFESQFELQKFNSGNKPTSSNEVNSGNSVWSVFEAFDSNPSIQTNSMTYGVVAPNDKSFTHNNMNIFNRMRDMDTPRLRDSRKLEYFSGSSTDGTYKPKREVEPFFAPVAGNTWGQGGMPSVTTFIESRMQDNLKMEKRSEKPFEPRRIGPGIGLSVDQDSLGGIHDTTRVLPKTVDELRRADDPKVSYQPPVLPGKKGEKRSVVAPFEHRKPDKFRENDAPIASGGQIKAQRTADNINLELGNRTFSTPVIGPASGSYGVATPEMKGKVKAPKEKQLKEFNQGPASGQTQALQNQKAFKASDTQRNQTSVNYSGAMGGVKQAITPYDPKNIAQPTQQLPSYNPTGAAVRGAGANAFNPNHLAQSTQQLSSYNPTGAGAGFGFNAFNPNHLAQSTQQLGSYVPTGAGAGFGFNAFNPHNLAQPTQQLQPMQPASGAGNQSQGGFVYNPHDTPRVTQQQGIMALQFQNNFNGPLTHTTQFQDEARQTQQQDIMTQQFQNNITGSASHTTQFQDMAKNTQQQDVMTRQFQNNLTGAVSHTTQFQDMAKNTQQQDVMTRQFQNNLTGAVSHTTQFQDMAKQTQQQQLMTQQFQNNLTGPKGYIVPLQDGVKHTQQQDLMTQQFNMFLAGGNQGHTTQLQDMARHTQQQDLMSQQFNMGGMGTHQNSGYVVTDAHAPTTLKQLINYNGHINPVGNQSTVQSNAAIATQWYAPTTLKDHVKNIDYVGTAGITSQQINQMQFANANTNAFREVTVGGRTPTTANVNLAPSITSMGAVELRDQINIDRFNAPRQTNFNAARPDMNITQRTTPFYDDNINQHQISTLQTNPYYSNGPSQLYHYTNNPSYAQTINHQQLMIAPLGQSICTDLGRLQ